MSEREEDKRTDKSSENQHFKGATSMSHSHASSSSSSSSITNPTSLNSTSSTSSINNLTGSSNTVPSNTNSSTTGTSSSVVNTEEEERIKNLTVRAYLDQTVVPILLQGMSELVTVRPTDPVEWLANYLLKNNPKKKEMLTNKN